MGRARSALLRSDFHPTRVPISNEIPGQTCGLPDSPVFVPLQLSPASSSNSTFGCKKRKGIYESSVLGSHLYPVSKRRKGIFEVSSASGPLAALNDETPISAAVAETSTAAKFKIMSDRCRKNQRGVELLQNIAIQADLLPVAAPCKHCHAKRFHLEPKGFCCSDGEITLAPNYVPDVFWELFTETTELAKEFKTYIRPLNNTFAFTSLGVKYDKNLCKKNRGIYTFRAEGQIYHFLNELLPPDDRPSHLQLYFYDTDEQIQYRTENYDHFNPEILSILIKVLAQNPYSKFFRSLADIPDLVDRSIVIKNHSQQDQRVFNAPDVSQVAAIWVDDPAEEMSGRRDIVVHSKAGFRHSVPYFYGCYDSMQYPLLFPHAEPGWHEGIQKNHKRTSEALNHEPVPNFSEVDTAEKLLHHEAELMHEGQKHHRTSISCREYYAYKLQMRPNSKSILLHSGRLLQQYVVDMYVKLESSRLDYLRLNQDRLRSEVYEDIVNSIVSGESDGAKVGSKMVLPASFIGGPRDMRRRYIDAMTLVQRYGKPDLFLTITCNPSWPEIQTELLIGEEAQNRPDLVARVFRAKLELLKEELFKKQIFGPVAAYVYVIEFQKRGLPHAHFLIILKHGSKIKSPQDFDKYVCAEIPEKEKFPHLYCAVWKHMLHGPCGDLNPENICMKKNGKCKNHYPKAFCDQTTQTGDGYPIYRRRKNVEPIRVRKHLLDNRWVIPYNPYLLSKFNCHINVEICSTIKAVKYLYKYIYKGHDRVSFHLAMSKNVNPSNEIDLFQSARWVSPPEAIWRIYRFPLNDIFPPVINLPLHLENQQSVTYAQNANLENVVSFTPCLKTMLTEYFTANRIIPDARNYFYREFPEHFVWIQQQKAWQPRKKGFSIGRIVTASPREGARFCLRLLLNNVKGAFSYDDLLVVGNTRAKSFHESCLLRGLLQADNTLQLCLREASFFRMPQSIRCLFATILVYCNPLNPATLWQEFQTIMSEDYARLPGNTSINASKRALKDISFLLESMGKRINDYHIVPENINIDDVERGDKEINDELSIPISGEDLASTLLLNFEQKQAFDIIIQKSISNEGGAFFIDGPGGTGKTYLYKAILAELRSRGFIALATASSGVAASILPGGRTAHSRFKIPLNADEKVICKVSKQSGLARVLRAAKLIIWDEAPMMRREAIEAFELMMQDVCESDSLFGGKVIVFGGDFRQVLPVVPRGTIAQTVDASLVKSPLWPHLEKIKLSENMRAREDPRFSHFLLGIGDGSEASVIDDQIMLPSSMVLPYENESSISALIDETFPNLKDYSKCIDTMIN